MTPDQNSLMVILDTDEYCFLYDPTSFPELIECLLDEGKSSEESAAPAQPETPKAGLVSEKDSSVGTRGLTSEERREIARDLFADIHVKL